MSISIGSSVGGYSGFVGKTANVSQALGLSHNHVAAVEENNKKHGSHYSVDVEQRAANAQLVSMLV